MRSAPHRTVEAEVLGGPDDPQASPALWAQLLRSGPTDEAFQTRAWHRAWYASQVDQPLLILVRREGEPVALLPLVAVGDMAFFAGVHASDRLDVIGESSPAVLGAALDAVDGLEGVRLHHVPDGSPTPLALREVAEQRGWSWAEEEHEYAPALRIAADPDGARAAADKKSLRRHERALQRDGELTISVHRDAAAIAPQLDAFFDQHERRWADTAFPSLFTAPAQRRFYERLTQEAGPEGWLHFTRVDFDGEPVAFHYGFAYGRSLYWYKPSFAIEHARRSPGEVLLRHLIHDALALGLDELDFGMGDEPFKSRFATHVRRVRTYGIYR